MRQLTKTGTRARVRAAQERAAADDRPRPQRRCSCCWRTSGPRPSSRCGTGTATTDLGLVFAKEWGDLHGRQDSLGLPLQSNNIGQREFARIHQGRGRAADHDSRTAGTRRATLLLKAGVAPHVVQQRLGSREDRASTLDIYAHVLPSMGRAQRKSLRRYFTANG